MEKQKINEVFLKKQIEDCKARMKQIEMEYNQNNGVVLHCEWMLKNAELETEEIFDKAEEKIENAVK